MDILSELNSLANPEKSKILQGFFKTGKGEYGEGDIFLGISVPEQRAVAKKYSHLSISHLQTLLSSKIHDHRSVALFILTDKYKQSKDKSQIIQFYLKNIKHINNWDLVDLSAPKILGDFLLNKPRKILYQLANSKNIWEKRIAIISTYAFIKNNELSDTLRISEILLKDKHDLIQKAVGWMLRELGKKDLVVLENFLKQYHKTMPRTTLRYAIERFPENTRKQYLKGEIK